TQRTCPSLVLKYLTGVRGCETPGAFAAKTPFPFARSLAITLAMTRTRHIATARNAQSCALLPVNLRGLLLLTLR
ncbi:hypothetical protein, partial [Exiguobacterium indicum]|uniref:hypothetical protein n=1 Tax=Exiguobacterium indicum TaxID=296995 RepID=UPI002B25AD0F